MKVYAFVPAKGTSERIENKNTRFLAGERLYIKALKTLLHCKEVDKVFLDTEKQQMYDMIDYLPVTFMKRNPELANNKTDGHRMFMNEVNSFPDADIYVQLLCTSPFIKPETIDNAIRILKKNNNYDSAVLMKKDKYYFWNNGKPVYDIDNIPNSKDLPETIIEAMGLYVVRRDAAVKTQRRYGENPYLIYGDLEEFIDVNNEEDLKFASIYAQGLNQSESIKFKTIKHFLSSALLSDIIDDLEVRYKDNVGAVVNGFNCNLKDVKLLGRAATIKLRKLKDNEDFNGIYNALDSYKSISENDIIICENELSEYAYFGDLNSRLAIRAGAQGFIIDGVTRDKDAVRQLNFPVFSCGYNSKDVRRRATLSHINKPITIKGKIVNPKDLIFIDDCSMVIIYEKYEKEILDIVAAKCMNEKYIVNDILTFKDTDEIIENRGAF
ncbi:MAG: hypothetical protein LUB59_03420 [Candidatus Gastranaerophilales bacterium]|nr:hypothetical protein [Candidatus Gastranaerophilales bacterium]